MKHLIVYYFYILAPPILLIWMKKIQLIDTTSFGVLVLFYLLIYRTYIDGKRLVDKNVITKKDIWKMIIPGKRITYFKELYLS